MIRVTVEDIGGSFERFVRRAPVAFMRSMDLSVKETAEDVLTRAIADAPYGPDGEGLTPLTHISEVLNLSGRADSMVRDIGIFDDPDNARVLMFNEWNPNHQPFLRTALHRQAKAFEARSTEAVNRTIRELST